MDNSDALITQCTIENLNLSSFLVLVRISTATRPHAELHRREPRCCPACSSACCCWAQPAGPGRGLALAFEMPLLREKCTVKLDQKMCCTSYASILWCIVFNTDAKMLTKLYLSSFALLLTHFMHTFTDFFQWKVVSLLVQYQHRRVYSSKHCGWVTSPQFFIILKILHFSYSLFIKEQCCCKYRYF